LALKESANATDVPSIAASVIGLVGIALIVPAFQWTSNCGGNNAGLADVRLYLLIAQPTAESSPNGAFDVARANVDPRKQLAEIANDPWIGDARFLVSTSPYTCRSSPREILIVCDGAFRNVPRRLFGQSPPTHATAFTDGSVDIISVGEFQAQNRSMLTPVGVLLDKLKQ
jgi:hypothetical protein